MKETYGFSEAIIPKGRLKGVEEDLLTLDYGGWLPLAGKIFPKKLRICWPRCAPIREMPSPRRTRISPSICRVLRYRSRRSTCAPNA